MIVVQINAVYEYSSTGRTTKEMHEFFTNQGWDSYVFVASSDKYDNRVIKVGNVIDYKLHALTSRITGKQAYYSRISTKHIISRLKDINPDVVILRNLHSNYISFPDIMNYLAKNNIAVIIVLHDCWFFTGHCCYYTDSGCEKWRNVCGKCPSLKMYNKSLFLDKTTWMLKQKEKYFKEIKRLAIVGVSEWITNEARKSILKDSLYLKTIYNWIDMSIFHPKNAVELRKKLDLQGKFVAIGVAQTWSEVKGIDIFLKLAHEMKDVQFVLVGNMPDIYQLTENIKSVGVVSSVDELSQYYSMADVMVNPSVQETFGKVTAEALCCGTPVIIQDATANPELIGEDCGYVIDFQNFEDVRQSMSMVMKNGKEYYTQHCIKHAMEKFNKETLLSEYVALIQTLDSFREEEEIEPKIQRSE